MPCEAGRRSSSSASMLRADATNTTSNGFSRKTRRHSATVGPSRLSIAAMAAAAEIAVPTTRDDQSLSKGMLSTVS
jgi:hypothetical protein